MPQNRVVKPLEKAKWVEYEPWTSFPRLRSWIRLRWTILTPLHKPLFWGYSSLGEMIVIILSLLLIANSLISAFSSPQSPVHDTGLTAVLPLAVAFGLSARNSIFTFLIGIPFDRALLYHKMAAMLSVTLGIGHGISWIAT
uniref:Ferric oxidoreductase domain-containing protein n=1 Tax=Spongospora subterranea TaxID=70186 RepID=A0A0H5QNR7_9EUKA|eukprot:CRZ03653.1 hypothetical protein [Spongospora subterranea]